MRLSQRRQSKHKAHLINSRPNGGYPSQVQGIARTGLEAHALYTAFALPDGPLGASLVSALASRAEKPKRKRLKEKVL